MSLYDKPEVNEDGVDINLQNGLDRAELDLNPLCEEILPKLKNWLEKWKAEGLPESELRGVIETSLINFEKHFY